MAAPSAQEVERMRRLKAIMEGQVVEEPVQVTNKSTKVTDSGVSGMKDILLKFKASTGDDSPVTSLSNDPVTPPVQESDIGWDVVEVTNNGVTEFNVNYGMLTLVRNMAVREAATHIADCMAAGGAFNDPTISKAIDMDEMYKFARTDAVVFKQKSMSQSVDDSTKAAALARYEESRAEALAIREKINKLVGV